MKRFKTEWKVEAQLERLASGVEPKAPMRRCRACEQPFAECPGACWGFWKTALSIHFLFIFIEVQWMRDLGRSFLKFFFQASQAAMCLAERTSLHTAILQEMKAG